jgi:hypothetical protein
LGAALFLLAVVLAATTNHSFWIDECVTATFACHENLATTWREVVHFKFSEMQMPFYITYMWAFARLFGSSELTLRLAALPFFVGGMTLLVVAAGRRWQRQWPMALAIGLSPFAWYYLNEARPYAMQLGAAAAIVAALLQLGGSPSVTGKAESRWLWVLLLSLIALSGLSMLGEIWTGGALLATLVVVPKERLFGWWRTHRPALVVTAILLLALGLYYLWTLTLGARATAVGSTNLQTCAFIFYEQLGFMGIGPGRIELREAGGQALKPFALGLAAYAAFTSWVLLAGIRALGSGAGRRQCLGVILCVAVPSVLILLAGITAHFRVLGRHFTPFVPVLFLLLAAGLLQLWRRSPLGKVVVTLFCACTLWSCLLIRFAHRHDKDNYREAATLARQALAEGRSVWWNAGDLAADYYRVPLTTKVADQGTAWFVASPAPGFATSLSQPDVVITSKPDVYDALGGLAGFLKANHYETTTNFMAFTIWQRAGKNNSSR